MHRKAILKHLSKEPKIAALLTDNVPRERPDFDGDVYFGLLRSITYQQLSGAAAGTIWGRFLELFPDGYPHPEQLLELDDPAIRGAGMSRGKTAYLQNVARYWLEEKLIKADWAKYSGQEILIMLTSIKGVGQWTVEMVLIFILHRPDLLPLGDLVVKRNIIQLFEIDTEKLKGRKLNQRIIELTDAWRPYRSYASRVMWALEA